MTALRVMTFAFACALALAAHAQPVPPHTGWVNDTAAVFSEPDRARLSKLLADYHRETHHQFAVLTVATLSGETIEAFSLRVANAWGLGYKGHDNGVLVTLAMKERRIRIEFGKGMERHISNAQAQAVIDETMVPAFKKGDFAGGVEAGLGRLMTLARKFVVHPPPQR
jgi:uncharacterized protein